MSKPSGFKRVELIRDDGATHAIYVKQHTSQLAETADSASTHDRTVFVTHLPIDLNDQDIRNTFNSVVSVESISRSRLSLAHIEYPSGLDIDSEAYINHYRNPNRNVHMVLESSSDLVKLLKSTQITIRTHSINTCSSLLQLYKSSRPAHSAVKDFTNSFMKQFEADALAEKHRQISNEKEAQMEDDGFTLVERGGKHGRAANEAGVQVASKLFNGGVVDEDSAEYRRKKRKFNQPLDDFYRWQRRERKREDLANLRLKFEKDKKRVDELKQHRRYKPY